MYICTLHVDWLIEKQNLYIENPPKVIKSKWNQIENIGVVPIV